MRKSQKPQNTLLLLNVLKFSFLMHNWLFPCYTRTFHKHFWCPRSPNVNFWSPDTSMEDPSIRRHQSLGRHYVVNDQGFAMQSGEVTVLLSYFFQFKGVQLNPYTCRYTPALPSNLMAKYIFSDKLILNSM